MESILTVENLCKSFGDKVIFENLSFGISKGQKVALVGRNGEGKSTLLNLLFNPNSADSGRITFNSESYPVYLPQKTIYDSSTNITQELLSAYDKNQEEEETFLARAKEIMYIFGLTNMSKPLNLLSGGEQKKVGLAKVLLKKSNFIVLDEPTNHLDIDMIKWLEEYLLKKHTTLLLVTHDRTFIDNICTDIYEIDNKQIYKYNGNFEYFLAQKSHRQQIRMSEIEKARNLYAKESEWVSRMPQARGTKSKKRIENFQIIKEKAFQKQEIQAKKLSVVETRIGKKILEINSVSKSFDKDKILIKDFSYIFKKGDKIAVIGHNGCGKSTLLNIIMGYQHPDSGNIIKGDTINFGYYCQQGLDSVTETKDKRVIDIIRDCAESIQIDNGGKKESISAMQFLERFGFDRKIQFRYYDLLSGGEKRRLYLLRVLITNPNFLILDEPTNDLDIYSLMALEEFLENYKGCLLFVSHDRRFIENISQNHAFIFENAGIIKDYYKPYSQYLQDKKAEKNNKKAESESTNANQYNQQKSEKAKLQKQVRLSYKEKRLKEDLEKEIPLLEQEKKDLTEKLSLGNLSNTELTEISQRIQQVIDLLDEKELQWLELSEKSE